MAGMLGTMKSKLKWRTTKAMNRLKLGRWKMSQAWHGGVVGKTKKAVGKAMPKRSQAGQLFRQGGAASASVSQENGGLGSGVKFKGAGGI